MEYIIEICVAIDIAILGIAYPIIVDKISNIGDKYSSQYIPVLFNSEFPQKAIVQIINKREYSISIFKLMLYVTLFSLFFLIFNCLPPFGWDNWIINNSAKIIVLILSSTLTVFFFIWLDMVVLYNGKSKSLLKHIIDRFDRIKDNTEIKQYHLKGINELTFYAIDKQDDHLQETLLEFYYKIFANIRRNHNKSEPLVYPIDLYFLVSRLNFESSTVDNKKLKAIEHRAVSGIWLLGEDFENISISEETYSWLWRNIYTICDNPKLIKMFWANSSQYFQTQLRAVYPEYDFERNLIGNKEQIRKRDEERHRFLEFHYALGGLLVYRKQYKLLTYMFEYSQSQPPQYVLLPETMTDIFHWFENFRNEFNYRGTPIDLKYSFPELDNLGSRRQVNYWICCYISILFLRQYTLSKHYVYQEFTRLPDLPDNVIELRNWLDSVSFFEKCLKDIIINQELIGDLDYGNLIAAKSGDFDEFINRLKEKIKNKIGQQKLNAELSQEKIDVFYQNSNSIITKAFEVYDAILIPKDDDYVESDLKVSVNGATTLMSKSAFTDNDIPHMNYDTVFAASIATDKIHRSIPNSFFVARTKRYLLNKDNVLLGLNKIIGANSEIVIISINIGYQLKEILGNSRLENNIQYFTSTEHNFNDVLFVLPKKDLPAIEHKEIKDTEKQEFQLVAINEELKIYASVIDINTIQNESVKAKWNLPNDSYDTDLKVQLAISFLSIIYWKNERQVIQINIASEFSEQGIQNDINDIEPLVKNEKKS